MPALRRTGPTLEARMKKGPPGVPGGPFLSRLSESLSGRVPRQGVPAASRDADTDRLDLGELLDAFEAPLAADTTLLVTPEGQVTGDADAAVDAESAGANALGDRHGTLGRADHHAAETVHAVVGDANGVFLILVGDHDQYRPENLLLGDAHVVGNVHEAGRLDEEAVAHVGAGVAAREQGGAFFLADLDVLEDTVHLLLGNDRAHDAARFVELAPLVGETGVGHLERFHSFVAAALRHQQPGRHGTALAGVEHRHGAHDGLGKVRCVFQHQEDGLAAELKEYALEGVGAVLHDDLAHRSGTGEGHQVDARVLGQPFSGHDGVCGADDVEDASGQAGFNRQLGHVGRHDRGVRCGLEHHGAACQHGGHRLADVNVQWHVPGRDGCDNAGRFARYDALGIETLLVAHTAILLPFQFREALQQAVGAGEGKIHLRTGSGTDGRAGFNAGDLDQGVAVGVEQVAVFLHQLEAVFVLLRPVGFVEGATGCGDGSVDVFGRRVSGLTDHFAGPGADVVVGFAAAGGAQDAVDVQLAFRKFVHVLIL